MKLLEAAKRQGYIYPDQKLPVVLYPKEYEINWIDKERHASVFQDRSRQPTSAPYRN